MAAVKKVVEKRIKKIDVIRTFMFQIVTNTIKIIKLFNKETILTNMHLMLYKDEFQKLSHNPPIKLEKPPEEKSDGGYFFITLFDL